MLGGSDDSCQLPAQWEGLDPDQQAEERSLLPTDHHITREMCLHVSRWIAATEYLLLHHQHPQSNPVTLAKVIHMTARTFPGYNHVTDPSF